MNFNRNDPPRCRPVAVSFADRPLSILHVVYDAPPYGFDYQRGMSAGFTLDESSGRWSRDLTDSVIERELTRNLACADYVKWRLLQGEDIPRDRTERDTWIDDGESILPSGERNQ